MDGKSMFLLLRQFQGIYKEKSVGHFPELSEPTQIGNDGKRAVRRLRRCYRGDGIALHYRTAGKIKSDELQTFTPRIFNRRRRNNRRRLRRMLTRRTKRRSERENNRYGYGEEKCGRIFERPRRRTAAIRHGAGF